MKSGVKRKRSGQVGKGAPSGFVISLIFHGVAFFVAGIFVVFTVLPKKPPIFEAPPVSERPKMSLKKPKVKIKKSSSPKPSSRIVANVKMAKMPEISIPDLVGSGEGLMGGMGGLGGDGFGLPGNGTVTSPFGDKFSTGHDLVGTYYDLNRRCDGGFNGVDPMTEIGMVVSRFIKSGCDKRVVARYYHSPPLYAVGVMIPRMLSPAGPTAFGLEGAKAEGWFVHYEGKLVHPTDIRFRFWGNGDDIMVVLVDKEVVLSAGVAYNNNEWVGGYELAPGWVQHGTTMNEVIMGGFGGGWSEWIDLKAGESHDLDIIIGESPGGHFMAMLNVEVDGVEYERTQAGFPTFPMFKTDDLSWEQQDAIYQYLVPGESCLTNGPVFRDY